jgi:tetratricopeptide (TPR) repeat protein
MLFIPLLSASISHSLTAQSGPPATLPETQQRLGAREQLNLGVDAYKGARYGEAVEHFRRAAELDPSLPLAKLYLGTALAQNVVPGLETPENLKTADEAASTFLELLKENPKDSNGMKQLAGIYFQIKKLNDAKQWQKKVLDVDPHDADAAYTIGVIDWTLAHGSLLGILAPLNVFDDGEGNLKAPAEAIARFRGQNAALIDEGIAYLNQAIEDRPDYDDAMQYMNLVYRLKASIDRDDEPARSADLNAAKEWTTKAMIIRRARRQQKAGTSSN